MNDKAAQNRADRVQTVFERGRDANCARPRGCPEKILVLCRAGGAQGPIRVTMSTDSRLSMASQLLPSQLVRRQRQAGIRWSRRCRRRRETEGLCLAIEVGPEHARLRADDARGRVDADALHARQVDHQTAVADRFAGDAVTTALYRDEQIVVTRELHRRDDVGRAGAAAISAGRWSISAFQTVRASS